MLRLSGNHCKSMNLQGPYVVDFSANVAVTVETLMYFWQKGTALELNRFRARRQLSSLHTEALVLMRIVAVDKGDFEEIVADGTDPDVITKVE